MKIFLKTQNFLKTLKFFNLITKICPNFNKFFIKSQLLTSFKIEYI